MRLRCTDFIYTQKDNEVIDYYYNNTKLYRKQLNEHKYKSTVKIRKQNKLNIFNCLQFWYKTKILNICNRNI